MSAEEKQPYKQSEGKKSTEDADGVKKPQARSAYILFCNAHREEIKKKNPGRCEWRG